MTSWYKALVGLAVEVFHLISLVGVAAMYSSASSTSIAYCILLLATVRVVYTRWIRNRLYRRPPGPNPIPFLGNVHQLPMDYQEAAILEWGKRYGELGPDTVIDGTAEPPQ